MASFNKKITMRKLKMISILVVVAMAVYACGNNSEKEDTQESTESTIVIESESSDIDDVEEEDVDEDIDDAIDTYNKVMDATDDLLETAKELESLSDDDADYEDAMNAAEKSLELSKQALDLMESMD
jgi:tetratricopeptide (TPR) repeat protein